MTDTLSERRLAENEVIFREMNERIKEAVETNFGKQAGDLPLEFYCECSDPDCRTRIALSPAKFTKAHANPKCFTIAKGHDKIKIEKVVESCSQYDIVEKYEVPPLKTDGVLNKV